MWRDVAVRPVPWFSLPERVSGSSRFVLRLSIYCAKKWKAIGTMRAKNDHPVIAYCQRPQWRRSFAIRAVLFAAIWWVLTGGESDAWVFGMVCVALALALSVYLLPPVTRRHLSLAGFLEFLVFFLVQSIQAGGQVAWMAMRPHLDLHPAILEIGLRLPEDAPRIFLAATLSLLPGTLSAGLEGNRLLLHVLDRRRPIEESVRRAEARVARMFQVELT